MERPLEWTPVSRREAQFVVADLADESGGHPEDRRGGDGVGGGAAGHVFHPEGLERLPDPVAGLVVHVLHASLGKMEFVEQGVIRQDGQDVREGIAYS